jgi:hypothetical protein
VDFRDAATVINKRGAYDFVVGSGINEKEVLGL